ncbi:hypothetical protein [Alicyclobacillus fodiniaquatilis]|jgi:hypothetical protein|uniref:Flagellar FliJ protein n=1 Tax=Alicyclobacillus fodiniaquatilis TaxID=1661150 RepID=A0ABW4JEI0_9BACL
MSEFAGFSSRYHKIKQNLKDVEAAQYTRLLQQQDELDAEWQQLDEAKRAAREAQVGSTDLQLWQAQEFFQRRIEEKLIQLQQARQEMGKALEAQQLKLRTAFIEEKKWSHVAADAREAILQARAQRTQVEADDEALKRYRKVDA